LLSQTELEELVHRTITLYNRFHSPEATAKPVNVTLEKVTVAYSGSFCYTCGVTDFLEDFIHEFKMLTGKAELKIDRTRQVNPRTFEADYKVKHL
jgi:hypothetical protein